jgi:hypothetical protein
MSGKEIDLIDPQAEEDTFIQYENKNPFYLSFGEKRFQKSDLEFLKKEYKRIYILTIRGDSLPKNIQVFYDKNADINTLIELKEEIIIVDAPLDILELDKIFNGIIRVDKNILENFNHNKYDLNENEIVYLMLGSREKFVSRWAKKHEKNQLIKFAENVIIRNYYEIEDFTFDNHILNSIRNIPDFLYWTNEKNWRITGNENFRKRFFNFEERKIDTASLNITNMFKGFVKRNSNYNFDEENISENDVELFTNKVSNHYDFDFSNCEFSVNEIEELIKLLKPKEMYLFIWGLMISKKYYHYIINNPNIDFNILRFQTFLPVYKCILRYTWIMAILEENKDRYNIKQSDRFIFNIDIASKLPSFPFTLENIYTSPYIPPFIDFVLFNKQKADGICSVIDKDYGIVTLEEFKRRMNIFISGNAETNILEGVNWSNMVMTGGIMAATLPKFNPLILNFEINEQITDESFGKFCDEYYHYTDVDLACNHTSLIDFMDHVFHVMDIIKKNTNSDKISVKPNKSMNIYLNKKLIEEKCKKGEIPFNFDYLVDNLNANDVKLYLYEMYLEHKKKSNNNTKKILGDKINNDVYFAAASYCLFDNITINISDRDITVINAQSYKSPESNNGIDVVYYSSDSSDDGIYAMFSENIKYSIYTPKLKHSFELFRISNSEFFSIISRFHLPCVRAYYNGETCYMTPSAITSYMTLVNIDFKYVGGKNNPIEIIDKYRMRGFTTLMNKKELDMFVEYIRHLDEEKKKYKYINKSSIIGKTNLNFPLFRPRLHVPERFKDRIEPKYTDKLLTASTYSDVVNHYVSEYNFPKRLFNRYSCDEIVPLDFSIIEMLYGMLN